MRGAGIWFKAACHRSKSSCLVRQLSFDISQSCHLAMHSEGQIVVVARMESAEMIGFSVRIGYRRPPWHTLSGAILYAFQPR